MNELLKGVEAIIYINRRQDTKRNSKFIERWSKVTNIPLHRIEAVVPQSMDLAGIVQNNITKFYKDVYDVVGTSTQEKSEMCCSMSHAKAWEFAKNNRMVKFLVLEDDTYPVEIEKETKKLIGDFIPENSFLTYLNYMAFTSDCGAKLSKNGYNIDCYSRNNAWAITEGGIFSSSAYIVNFKLITDDIYYKIISTLTGGVIVDYYFSEFIQKNFTCAVPRIRTVKCDTDFKSTIGEDYKGIVQAYENDVYEDGYVFGHSSPVDMIHNKYMNRDYSRKYLTVVINNTYTDIIMTDNLMVDLGRLPNILNTKYDGEFIYSDIADIKIFTTEYQKNNFGHKEYIHQSKKTLEEVTTDIDFDEGDAIDVIINTILKRK